MATLEDFQKWLERDLSRFGDVESYVETSGPNESTSIDDPPVRIERVRIYTDTNRYTINAQEHADDDTGYLGCVASSRKPRAGEDWTRGRDLADGSLSEQTWYRILGDIVSFEMVRLHKPDAKTETVVEAA